MGVQGHLPGQPGTPISPGLQALPGALICSQWPCRSPCPCAPRVEWAKARQAFFSSGKNKAALDAIERAAFFVALDEESHHYDPDDEASLSLYGKALLHGNCYNRYSLASCVASAGPAPAPTSPVSCPAGGLTSLSPSSLSRMASWASIQSTRGQTPLS